MAQERPFTRVIGMLNRVGLRPTRQRLALARLLFDGANRHVTAEQLHDEAVARGVSVSLATVYNTLHQFTAAKVLREVVVEPGRSHFDTNTAEHHHFFFEDTGEIRDIPAAAVTIARLPDPPQGTVLSRVDVVVRLNGQPHSARRRAGN
jgi:Fur family iron response transcriptional regulator